MRQEAFSALDELLKQRAKARGDKRAGDIVALLLKKRFLSSPWAFARTLAHYDEVAGRASTVEIDDYYSEVLGSDQSDEEEGLIEHPEFEALARSKAEAPLLSADDSAPDVDRLIEWGEGYQHKPDSRLTALLTTLDAICRPDGTTWTNERVVIFTEYAATLEWLIDVLGQYGYADRLAVIQGSTPAEDREQIRAEFTAPPSEHPVRVLVATDAAGEGIDLQNHCHRLVNFDIPFNPSRLEQRIGRIDRYGQTHTPQVFYLKPTGKGSTYSADLSFMHRIAEKVSTVAADLGSVNPVIDDEIQQHFTGRPATRASKATKVTDAIINQALAGEQELNHSLTKLSNSYAARKDAMHLTAYSSRRVVDTALALSGQPPLTLVGDEDTDADVFEVGNIGPSWRPAVRGLDTRLHPGVLRPITFDDTAAAHRTDLVYVHLGHALLQKSSRILRSTLFGSDSRVHRVTAVVVPGLPVSCVAAVSRLVLVGRGGLRLHEDVFVTGIRIRGNAMAEGKVQGLLDRALDEPDLTLAGEGVRAALAEQWNAPDSRLRHRLDEAIRARAERRQSGVTEELDKRRDSDVERASKIFGAFRVNLGESLRQLKEAEAEQQAMLLPDDQHRQRAADIRKMEERLLTLDDEESREVAGLRERYADVQPFVSTAAVVFALTEADAVTMAGGK